MRGVRALWGGLTVAVIVIAVGLGFGRPPGWLDPAAHVVDGYWVADEAPCTDILGDCRVAIRAAIDHLRTVEPGSDVLSAVTAAHELPYMARDGQGIFTSTSGLARTVHVILDLADGRRRLVGVLCDPEPVSLEEPIILETVCRPSSIGAFRVGDEPWLADGG